MQRRLDQSAVAVLVALLFGASAAQELCAQEAGVQELNAQELHAQELHAQELNAQELRTEDIAGEVAAPVPAPSAASVRISGDAAALEVRVRRSTVADVLSALAGFNIRYRTSGALNDVIDGTYAGPLSRVLSRLLDSYNYAIKQRDAEIDVIIVSRHGEQAIPGPIIVQRRGSGE